MELRFGTRLGPYEILTPLGAGGMGEVYRARDTRLGRDVAVKVVPERIARDPCALARFEREARAVAALSHPGILALHDSGEADGVRYIVTELLEGETLRAVADRGPLPARRALEVACGVADALEAAHARGIAHRDVKPENVFLTRDRRVKLLDFGLSAWTGPAPADDEAASNPTTPTLTDPGALVGTVAYMSPEQARGGALDFRTDQFSLGVVLYELLAGARPFVRPSAPETLTAIIREEHVPLSRNAPHTPAPVRWIVDRLLSKEPEGRYASTGDLARELRAVLANFSELCPSPPAGAAPGTGAKRLRAALLALLAVVTLPVAIVHLRAGSSSPTYRRLTHHSGFVGRARFMAEGQTVVYGAGWDGQVPDVYAVRLDRPEARPLGLSEAGLLSVSRSGDLALSLDADGRPKRFAPWKLRYGPWKLGLAPFSGGAPRPLATGVHAADFAPDGTALAIARRAPGGGTSIELPVGKVLHTTPRGEAVDDLRVSPDGTRVAFIACAAREHPCDVAVLDRSGEVRVLAAGYAEADGLAWSPYGDEVWFGAAREGRRHEIRAASLSGRERLVLRQLDSVVPQDLDARGRALVTRIEVRSRILFRGEGDTTDRDLSWLEQSAVNDLSADGRTIVFQELGEAMAGRNVVYVRPTDGSPAVKLGEGRYSTISPDGRTVVSARLDGAAFVLYPLGPEPSRTVPLPGFTVDGPHLLADGRTVVFEGSESPNRPERVWRTDVTGSRPTPVTPEGVLGRTPFVAADGRHVLAKGPEGLALFPVDGGDPEPVRGIGEDERIAGWARGGGAAFVFLPGESPLRIHRVDLKSGRREPWREIVLADGARSPTVFRMTDDGRSYVYFFWRFRSDLHLVEGLE